MKLGSVKNVKVPVQVVLGRAELSLEEISSLAVGSIVGMRSLAGEPVEFVAAGEIIARGEVVVIDEYFGIRITKIEEKEP
jgi:flagellar motor switch protein FliN